MLFISYSTKDVDRLRPLVEKLKAAEVKLWIDCDKIGLGDSLARKISEGLAASDRLLVAWSENARDSNYVLDELEAFYSLCPEPPFILMLRLDDTPVQELFGARKYLRFKDDVDGTVQALLKWLAGQPTTEIHEAEATPPSPSDLHRFPRGPRVPFYSISDDLVSAYAEFLHTEADAKRIINKANRMRKDADPADQTVTILNYAFLPTFGAVGAYAYWQEVFHAACLNGPRVLGALLLAQPDDLFDTRARSDRAKLLQQLHTMNQPSDKT